MKRVFKYELSGEGVAKIQMPFGSEILSLDVQDNKPVLWVMVDDSALDIKEDRYFAGFQTGYPVGSNTEEHSAADRELKYIGSVLLIDQSVAGFQFGLHVFEVLVPIEALVKQAEAGLPA